MVVSTNCYSKVLNYISVNDVTIIKLNKEGYKEVQKHTSKSSKHKKKFEDILLEVDEKLNSKYNILKK